jgi:hypothetical protein
MSELPFPQVGDVWEYSYDDDDGGKWEVIAISGEQDITGTKTEWFVDISPMLHSDGHTDVAEKYPAQYMMDGRGWKFLSRVHKTEEDVSEPPPEKGTIEI